MLILVVVIGRGAEGRAAYPVKCGLRLNQVYLGELYEGIVDFLGGPVR